MIARLLHGFRYQSQPKQCCGRGWLDLPRHRTFAHGEEVVIPEQEDRELIADFFDVPPEMLPADPVGMEEQQRATFICFCGAPATQWVYDVMGDGQCIGGEARCQSHMELQT